MTRFWQMQLECRRDVRRAAEMVQFNLELVDGGPEWIAKDDGFSQEFRENFADACTRLWSAISWDGGPRLQIPRIRSVLRSLTKILEPILAMRMNAENSSEFKKKH